MESSIDLWLEYILRFSHLVAGIAWIGSSFYFIWLDSAFLPPQTPRHNVEGEVFMVHGGFYYQVDKKKIYPGEVPKILHWFKWEATLTWVTGFLLLIYLFFLRGASLLIDPRIMVWSQGQAIAVTLAMLVGAWFVYDFIWAKLKWPALSVFLSAVSFASLVYASTHLFSGRGAFILVGAILGSLMLLNVWVRILPGQTKMLKEAQAGQVPDYSVSLKSKVRSVHNTYFIFPVLFIMLSNHYPAIYSHEQSWLLLIILAICGALVRHAMVTKNPVGRWTLFPAVVGVLALVMMTATRGPSAAMNTATNQPAVDDAQIMAIFQSRCLSCHSQTNSDDVFKVAPKGVIFETHDQILNYKDKILLQVVTARTMPFANKTAMTDEERAVVGRWLGQD